MICSERQAKLLILCFVKSYTCLLLMCNVIKRFILENDFCGPTRTHWRCNIAGNGRLCVSYDDAPTNAPNPEFGTSYKTGLFVVFI